ncbi:DUF2232 domain-containing protein [Peptoniphilus asaccharolyticus]
MIEITTTLNKLILVTRAVFIAIVGTIFPPAFLFLPAIFVFEAISEGVLKSFLMFFAASVLLSIVSLDYGIVVFTLFGPMILVFHWMLSKNYDQHSTVFMAAAMFFISIFITAYSYGISSDMLKSKEVIEKFIQVQNNVNIEKLSVAEWTIIYNRFLQLMPAMLVIISLLLSYMTYHMSVKKLISTQGLKVNYQPFIYFSLPKGVLFAGVFSIAAVYSFGDQIFESPNLVIENLMLLFSSILFFLGLSVIMFMLNKIKASGFIKFLIAFLGFLVPGAQFVFIAMGVLDNIFNFRKLA